MGLRELYAFSCLSPLEDAALVNRLINAKAGNNTEMLDGQLGIATYSNVTELDIPPTLKFYGKKQLVNTDTYLAGEGLAFMAKFFPEDADAIKRAFKFIEESQADEDDSYYGYNALNSMKTKDPAILSKVITMIKKPGENDGSLLQFVINSKTGDPRIQKEFAGLLNETGLEEYEKERILLHFKEMKVAHSGVVEEVIKYIEGKKDYYDHNKALEVLKSFELSPELKQRVDNIR